MSRQPATWTRQPTFADNPHQPPACQGTPLNLWFPKQGDRSSIRQAKAICARCPLQPDCEAWAYEQPPHLLAGIWGGTTASQRHRHHRRRRETAPQNRT